MERFPIPYLLAMGAVVLALAGGAYVVFKNIPVAPQASGLQAWSGSGSALIPAESGTSPSGSSDRTSLMQQIQGGTSPDYILPNLPQGNLEDVATSSFDLNAFLQTLTDAVHASTTVQASGNADISGAYAFIPTGLIANTSPMQAKTPTQQALYVYGNDVGSIIQSYESLHADAPQILRDQAEDRTDAAKAAKLIKLGNDLGSVGTQMLSMDGVPPPAQSAHKALAEGYIMIGQKLALVPQAGNDTDFVNAVQAYDAAADDFIKKYVALAQLFRSYGVTFSQDDPGSVFTFNSNLQL